MKTVSLISGRIIDTQLVQDLEQASQEENDAWEFSQKQHEMKVKINDEVESDDECK